MKTHSHSRRPYHYHLINVGNELLLFEMKDRKQNMQHLEILENVYLPMALEALGDLSIQELALHLNCSEVSSLVWMFYFAVVELAAG